MWSFVGNKGNRQWIWLALDVQTKEVVGIHVGDRSREGARKLWCSLPPVYRQCAVCYSDFWEAYEQVIPSKRHQSVGKAKQRGLGGFHPTKRCKPHERLFQEETGKTSYIERFNCTLRQRVSRLVRKTLSFSKKIENHVGAIWYFVHHYNASLHL
jgi:insertion element IS1 protein InsB